MQDETNTSSQEDSGITKLTQQADTLAQNAIWYERWKDRADYASVALLALIFVVAFVGNRLGSRLNKTNKELSETREQLRRLQLATVEGNALKESKRVEAEAAMRIADARAVAATANDRAQSAILAQMELERGNLALQAQIEEEKRTRLALEKSLTPRVIPFVFFGGEKTNFDSLKPFAGTRVIIRFLSETEPRRTAEEIAKLLERSGWQRVSFNHITTEEPHYDGITVQGYFDPETLATDSSDDAARALVDFLKSVDIAAFHRELERGQLHGLDASLPPKTVKIVVDLKPDLYFEEKSHREFLEGAQQRRDKHPKG